MPLSGEPATLFHKLQESVSAVSRSKITASYFTRSEHTKLRASLAAARCQPADFKRTPAEPGRSQVDDRDDEGRQPRGTPGNGTAEIRAVEKAAPGRRTPKAPSVRLRGSGRGRAQTGNVLGKYARGVASFGSVHGRLGPPSTSNRSHVALSVSRRRAHTTPVGDRRYFRAKKRRAAMAHLGFSGEV